MHRFKASTLVLAIMTAGIGGQAHAQERAPQAANLGLRPLTWAGRAYAPQPIAQPLEQPVVSEASYQARPNVLSRGGYQINPQPYGYSAPAPVPQKQGLTPASSFYAGPAPRPVPFPAPISQSAPPVAADLAQSAPLEPSYAETPRPVAPAPVMALAPAPAPRQAPSQARAQAYEAPVSRPPAPQAQTQSASGSNPVLDAMAPRRDAPIFRIAPSTQAQAAPQPQAQAQLEPQAAAAPLGHSQPRYYSVHRQYGRQPDPTPTPPPVYLDALPVDVTGMAGTSDLAEPPSPPTLIRNQNGRIQALPDLGDIGH